jgi:hypothetical protein
MAANPLFGTVVHLTATGHVLAAVTSGSVEPTVEDLTGGDHLRVRVPGDTDYVDVPSTVLTASRVAIAPDVLDRPHWYVFGDGAVPLTLGLEPQYAVTVTSGGASASGKKVVIVWQTAEKAIAEDSVLDGSGNLPSTTPPPGATAELVAWEGGPLYVKPLP